MARHISDTDVLLLDCLALGRSGSPKSLNSAVAMQILIEFREILIAVIKDCDSKADSVPLLCPSVAITP